MTPTQFVLVETHASMQIDKVDRLFMSFTDGNFRKVAFRPYVYLLCIFAFSLSLLGCSTSGGEDDVLSLTSGVRWIWSEYTLPDSSELITVVVDSDTANTDFYIQFSSDTSYRGSDGCNAFAGSWAGWDNIVYLIDKLTTGAACPFRPNKLNALFQLPVGSEIVHEITNKRLSLTLTDGMVYIFRASD